MKNLTLEIETADIHELLTYALQDKIFGSYKSTEAGKLKVISIIENSDQSGFIINLKAPEEKTEAANVE